MNLNLQLFVGWMSNWIVDKDVVLGFGKMFIIRQ